MLWTPVCTALGIAHPICQAGMANYTSPELVAAVSRAGGLGCHGTLGRTPKELRALLRATKALLDGEPFAVNLVIGRADETILRVCREEAVPVYAFSWGDPRSWARLVRQDGAKVIAQVTTVAEVPTALDAECDALIAQGCEGGGHSGFVPLAELLPPVVTAAGSVPVLAAGGISDGRDLAAALARGAAGGWLGTRFLATPETPISAAWKRALLAAQPGDTIHTAVFDTLWGRPWPGGQVRSIKNRFTTAWAGRESALLAEHEQIQEAVWQAERDDNPELISLMAGSGVGTITSLIPAGELVRTLVAEAEAAIMRLTNYVNSDPAAPTGAR